VLREETDGLVACLNLLENSPDGRAFLQKVGPALGGDVILGAFFFGRN